MRSVAQASTVLCNTPMGHVFLPLALIADAAGKLGRPSPMPLVILPGAIIGVAVRAGMLAAAVPKGVQDITLHMQPCDAFWVLAEHTFACMCLQVAGCEIRVLHWLTS